MKTTSKSMPTERIQCMEIWGGNRAVDKSIEAPGLDLFFSAPPFRRVKLGVAISITARPVLREESRDSSWRTLGHFKPNRVLLRDNLLAAFRLLGKVRDNTQIGPAQ